MNRFSLDGDAWTVSMVGHDGPVPDERVSVPAAVPGCVHTDLMQAGLVPHPAVDRHEEELLWIGRSDWAWRRSFDAEAAAGDERVDLVCAGLDTVATVRLNGAVVATTETMHRPHRFDLRDALRPGMNELEIRMDAPVPFVEGREQEYGWRPVNGDWGAYAFCRKSACNFGWDWGPRVPTAGLVGSVAIERWRAARLEAVRPLVVEATESRARVEVLVDLERSDPGYVHELSIEARLERPDGGQLTARTIVPSRGPARLAFTIDAPRLWWPRGYGEPALHDLCVEVRGGAQVLDTWRSRIGLRTVRIDTAADEYGSRFTFEVNGRRVFCRGANWIPEGLFPADRSPAVLRERIDQACAANMNMLRVWGGGTCEDRAFYEACDERGVMVWQDFPFACGLYAEEAPYPAIIESEARWMVAALARHPSVVLYCGGNECVVAYESWGWKEQLAEGRTWGLRYWLDVLPRIVADVDRTRPYWPNSPWSGAIEVHPNEPGHGSRHTWDLRLEAYRDLVPRFVAEFGHQSPSNLATLAEVVPPDELAIDSESMRHRQRAGGGNAKQYDEPMAERFAPPETFGRWHYLAQVLQARALAIQVEWLRAHPGRCDGVLFWQLNDAWPGHSWSVIDAAGRRKPSWYAVRRSFAPRLLTVQPLDGEPCAVAVNDTDDRWAGEARLRRIRFDGGVLAEAGVAIDLAPRSAFATSGIAGLVGAVEDEFAELIVAELPGAARATWFHRHDRELALAPASWTLDVEPKDDGATVTVTAETLLRDLVIAADQVDPAATVSDNLVTLLPGERWCVRIDAGRPIDAAALAAAGVVQAV